MGYCMQQVDSKFKIVDVPGAFEALKALSKISHDWVGVVDNPESFESLMREWRWEYETYEQHSEIQFQGEKLGSEVELFNCLAPFVKAGSFIQMSGEEGDLWRYTFDGKKMIEKYAKISWE